MKTDPLNSAGPDEWRFGTEAIKLPIPAAEDYCPHAECGHLWFDHGLAGCDHCKCPRFHAERSPRAFPERDPLDLVCCPPGTCEHAACESRYLKHLGLRRYPKDPLEDRWPE